MTTVYLIRHGQTQGNLERRYIGSTDQPLCPAGREALAGRRMPPVDRVYASPLRRCRETAVLLYPGAEVEIVPDFRECDFGEFEMKTYEELKDSPAYRAWLDTGGVSAPPGGEGKDNFRRRTVAAFRSLAARWRGGETAALVVHGGTIMTLLEVLEPSHDFYRWQADNGCGFRCVLAGGVLNVESPDPRPATF